DPAFAAAGGVVGGQKAFDHVADWLIERGRIDGREGPGDDAGQPIKAGAHVHVNAERLAGIHAGAVVLPAGRDRYREIAEAEGAQLEGAPVQVGVELLCNGDDLSGGRGGRLILEVDDVRQRCVNREEARWAEAGRAGNEVGILRANHFGLAARLKITGGDWEMSDKRIWRFEPVNW